MHRLGPADKSPHQGVVLFFSILVDKPHQIGGRRPGKSNAPFHRLVLALFAAPEELEPLARVPPQLANAQMGVDGQADGTAVVIFTSRTKKGTSQTKASCARKIRALFPSTSFRLAAQLARVNHLHRARAGLCGLERQHSTHGQQAILHARVITNNLTAWLKPGCGARAGLWLGPQSRHRLQSRTVAAGRHGQLAARARRCYAPILRWQSWDRNRQALDYRQCQILVPTLGSI